MNRPLFEQMVAEVLDELPGEFSEKIENVDFVVETEPSTETRKSMKIDSGTLLLGLYHGVPLPLRTSLGYSGVLPDRITIYQKHVEALARTPDKVRATLKRTILHEIAHYFGISDRRLKDLGVY
ncbi:MAG TPA: metallopeptidase family protein [Bdellovibrionota bacterium]|nr:metallopeptidase family protein [Bdellovibrionota bacterium]